MNLHRNKRNSSLLLIVLAVIGIVFGVHEITRSDVDCSEHAMFANQVCQSTSDLGIENGDNLEQQRTSNTVWGVVTLIGSALAIGYATRNLIRIRMARAAGRPGMYGPPNPAWPNQAGQPPMYPPGVPNSGWPTPPGHSPMDPPPGSTNPGWPTPPGAPIR